MAENKDKVKLEDTFSADEAAVKTTSENKEEKAAVREEVLGKVEADLATYKNKAEEADAPECVSCLLRAGQRQTRGYLRLCVVCEQRYPERGGAVCSGHH